MDIIQIIVIPILTVLLNSFVVSQRERTKRFREKDNKVFKDFIELIPEDSPTISFLKEDSFRYPVSNSFTKHLGSVERLLNQASHSYLNNRIERAKIILLKSMEDFFEFSTANLFPSNQNRNEYIPKYYDKFIEEDMRWDQDIEQNFFATVNKLDSLTTEIYNNYIKLIKIARRHL